MANKYARNVGRQVLLVYNLLKECAMDSSGDKLKEMKILDIHPRRSCQTLFCKSSSARLSCLCLHHSEELY